MLFVVPLWYLISMNKFARDLLPGDTYKGFTVHSVQNGHTDRGGFPVVQVVVKAPVGTWMRFETFYPVPLAICPQV